VELPLTEVSILTFRMIHVPFVNLGESLRHASPSFSLALWDYDDILLLVIPFSACLLVILVDLACVFFLNNIDTSHK